MKSSGSQFCDLRALIQSQHGSFSRYVRIYERSLLETRASSPSPTAGSNPLFPSMLAWQKPPGKSRRRGHPKAVYREAFEWLKLVWMLFNYLDAGSPSSTHSIRAAVDRAAMGKWTAQHEGYARAMFVKLVRYCAHPRGTMDRGPAKLDELIRRIKISQYDPNLNLDEAVCGAKDVDPNRISLPQQAGILDPRDHLKDEKLQQFLEMPKNIPCVIPPGNGPVACHKVADEDWPTLLGKLHDAQMITFLKKQDVLKEGRRLIRGGLFCVPHKPESDRLINDRRPLNVRENRLDWCQLPAGHMLTQLLLGPSDSVRASGDDLSNYFYLIKHLEEWQHRNAFGKPFRGAILPGRGLDPKQLYLPAFRVVCMGDTNGVDLAQATHEAVLEDAGCLLKNETLVYGRVFPSSQTLEGLYIDDHLVFQVLPKKKVRDREKFRDEEITAAARQQYENLGLPRSLKKAFDKQYSFKAWGTQINSATGDASAPPEKLRQVESLAIAVLQCGVATQKAMQKLIGLFVHPFMHRRECMSIFHHIYRYIDRMGEGKKCKLPQHVKDELVTATLLLPFSGSNIRLPVSVQIAATDASSRRGGRAACLTTKAMAKTLYRFGEKRGEYTRLDWDLHAIPPPSKMEVAPRPLIDTMLKHRWVATHSIAFEKRDHINLLELEMIRQEIRDRVVSGRGHCRVVNLCDSRVVVGAFGKGRSSFKQMNQKLRAILPWAIAGEISLTNIWVPTDCNPADHPSRGKEIPPPCPVQDDPLLSHEQIVGAQVYRSPGVQKFLEQECQSKHGEPLTENFEPEQKCDTGAPEDGQSAPKGQTVSREPKLKFREIFAGRARLTSIMKKFADITVLEPVDLYYGTKLQNILDPKCFKKLLEDAKEPNQLWHFGLPCGSFSILQHSNGGTRRKINPAGDGHLEREVIGNELLRRTCILIDALEKAGNWWTLENPKSSYAWLMPKLDKKLRDEHVSVAVMHQCAYGLRLKDEHGQYGPCKKHTQFAGNIPGVDKLSKSCNCKRAHVYAVGGVKTKSGWKRRSELAGHYPTPLCHAYGKMVTEAKH